jgi:hypothetical protein
MKKITLLFLVLCVAANFAAAEDEGAGLSAGLEFGVVNASKADDSDISLYLMPMLIYENSFFDGALDLYAELDYTLGLADEDDSNPQSLYVDLSVGYNISLGEESTLSFILENEFDEIIISPKIEDGNSLTGIFTPAVKFNQSFSFGDLYAQIGAPVTYIQYDKDADTAIGLDFTLGWDSGFGLGIKAKICSLLTPSDAAGYTGLELTVSYEVERVYFEVEALIPNDIDNEGITITPEFDYYLKNLTFYLKSEFSGIGTSGDIIISPALGIKYSF